MRVSNDNAEDEHCVVVFVWGNEGGSKETRQNRKIRSRNRNEMANMGDVITNRIVERISTM